MKDLKFLVRANNGRIVAAFLRRWEAETYIKYNSEHADDLVLEVIDDDQKGGE